MRSASSRPDDSQTGDPREAAAGEIQHFDAA